MYFSRARHVACLIRSLSNPKFIFAPGMNAWLYYNDSYTSKENYFGQNTYVVGIQHLKSLLLVFFFWFQLSHLAARPIIPLTIYNAIRQFGQMVVALNQERTTRAVSFRYLIQRGMTSIWSKFI